MKPIEASNENAETTKSNNSFYFEENSVKLDDGCVHDLNKFREYCDALRESIKNAWQRKKSKEKINASQFASLIIAIKELNRRTQFRIRKTRDITSENKNKVDQLHLGLQNLLYEVAHLEHEIHNCLEFRSRHENMNLIPVDEFYEKTNREIGSLTPHEETLERLYWESEQRKLLSDSCEKLKCSIESVSQKIKNKRNYLASFGPKLKDVTESTLIVQELMGLPFTKEDEQYQSSFLLPPPLYILYVHLKSFISMSGTDSNFSVSIEGDTELAKAMNQTIRQSNSSISPADQDDSDGEDGEPNKKHKNIRHKETVNIYDKSVMVDKASLLHPLTVSLTISIQKCENIVKASDFHLNLSFAWLVNLNLITVRLKVPVNKSDLICQSFTGYDLLYTESLLTNLKWSCDSSGFTDSSADSPCLLSVSSGNNKKSENFKWDACLPIGRPYSWAQQIVGLKCFPSQLLDVDANESLNNSNLTISVSKLDGTQITSNESNSNNNIVDNTNRFGQIEAWLKAVQSRVLDRLYLFEELSEIEKGSLLLSFDQKQLIPLNNKVRIITWEKSSFEELKQISRAQFMISLNLIQPDDAIFLCKLGQTENTTVSVWICIPPNYPHTAPILILDGLIQFVSTMSSQTSDNLLITDLSELHIQELEAEVNCYWHEFFSLSSSSSLCNHSADDGLACVSTSPKLCPEPINLPNESNQQKWCRNILSCQLARCCACIFALCNERTSIKSGHFRNVKYPTRSLPLRYLPNPGAFVHR